jgi:hypothetical protein
MSRCVDVYFDDICTQVPLRPARKSRSCIRYKTIEKYPQIIYRCPPVLLARMFFSALLISFQFVDSIAKSKEMFEDSKGAIRSRKSKNDRHYNGRLIFKIDCLISIISDQYTGINCLFI